jgi:hypothetical protein
MAIQSNSREFITWHSIEPQFDGPTALLPWLSILVPLSLQLGACGWKSDFWNLPEVRGLSGSMIWEYRAITTCDLLTCLAQLSVAKAHCKIWTIAIAQGGSSN